MIGNRQTSVRYTWVMVLAVAVLTSSACDRDGEEVDDERPQVAAILATSGPADFIGGPERKVLEAMRDDYREHSREGLPFTLRFYDSGGEVKSATEIFERVSSDQDVVAIIGPSTSGESIALAERAEEKEIPLLSLAASREIVFADTEGTETVRKWSFKFAQNDNLAADRLARTMVAEGDSSVSLLYSDDGFGQSGAEVFREAVGNTPSLELSHSTAFPPSLTQAGSFINGLPSDTDALLIWGTAPGPALLLNEARSQDVGAQIYFSHGNASHDFLEAAGAATEGTIVVGSRVLQSREYLNPDNSADATIINYRQFWRTNFSGYPSHFGGHARDALEALLEVDESSQYELTRTGIRSGLESSIRNLHGVTGTFNFTEKDHAGLGPAAFGVYVVQNGEFVPINSQ